MPVRTIEWRNGRVVMIDQRLLPTREVYRVYRDHREVARAIKEMVIRGAPAIGVAAAMGIALGARRQVRLVEGEAAAGPAPHVHCADLSLGHRLGLLVNPLP